MTGSTLTTPPRVRRQLGFTDPTLTDAAIQEFIDGATAWIEAACDESFLPNHPRYELAAQVCTDRACYMCVTRPAGGVTEGLKYKIGEFSLDKAAQQSTMKATAASFEKSADKLLAVLKADTADLPFSNTGSYG
jgi:hypothetical protein